MDLNKAGGYCNKRCNILQYYSDILNNIAGFKISAIFIAESRCIAISYNAIAQTPHLHVFTKYVKDTRALPPFWATAPTAGRRHEIFSTPGLVGYGQYLCQND